MSVKLGLLIYFYMLIAWMFLTGVGVSYWNQNGRPTWRRLVPWRGKRRKMSEIMPDVYRSLQVDMRPLRDVCCRTDLLIACMFHNALPTQTWGLNLKDNRRVCKHAKRALTE